jgi:hypothetical protein
MFRSRRGVDDSMEIESEGIKGFSGDLLIADDFL